MRDGDQIVLRGRGREEGLGEREKHNKERKEAPQQREKEKNTKKPSRAMHLVCAWNPRAKKCFFRTQNWRGRTHTLIFTQRHGSR